MLTNYKPDLNLILSSDWTEKFVSLPVAFPSSDGTSGFWQVLGSASESLTSRIETSFDGGLTWVNTTMGGSFSVTGNLRSGNWQFKGNLSGTRSRIVVTNSSLATSWKIYAVGQSGIINERAREIVVPANGVSGAFDCETAQTMVVWNLTGIALTGPQMVLEVSFDGGETFFPAWEVGTASSFSPVNLTVYGKLGLWFRLRNNSATTVSLMTGH